jgi:hypothetical protein
LQSPRGIVGVLPRAAIDADAATVWVGVWFRLTVRRSTAIPLDMPVAAVRRILAQSPVDALTDLRLLLTDLATTRMAVLLPAAASELVHVQAIYWLTAEIRQRMPFLQR